MTTQQTNFSLFARYIWMMLCMLVFSAIAFAYYVRAEKQIDHANVLRQQSYVLVDELRNSSSDLTRMARTYVATGEPTFKQHFHEILDIRDGKRPRPISYPEVYWDLVQSDEHRPRPMGGATPLLSLAQRGGLTAEELALLMQAKMDSDTLAHEQMKQMDSIDTLGATAGATADAARIEATRTLYGKNYQHAMARVMQSVAQLQQRIDLRTLNNVHDAEILALRLRYVFIALGLVLIYLLWRIYQNLHLVLGCSVDELYERIRVLGKGNFSASAAYYEATENSVSGWLAQMQRSLARVDRERSKFEDQLQRLSNLHAALSQCSQAIVRCADESELFAQVCRDVVSFGGIDLAWIGLFDERAHFIVRVAAHGAGVSWLDGMDMSLGGVNPFGGGPGETGWRNTKPIWVDDFLFNPATARWVEVGKAQNWAAFGALPLYRNGEIVGILCLHATAPESFDEMARSPLEEIALIVSFALDNFVSEAGRMAAEAALRESEARYRVMQTVPGEEGSDKTAPTYGDYPTEPALMADNSGDGQVKGQVLHLLLAERSGADADIVAAQLQEQGIEICVTRVADEASLRQALAQAFDLVVVVYPNAAVEPIRALALLRERPGPTIPMILLSDTVGVDEIMEAIRYGEVEWIARERVDRLADVVRRTFEVASMRETQRVAQEQLAQVNVRLARLSAQLIDIQEQERKNLAREMHDELGQQLTLLKISVHRIRDFLDGPQALSIWEKIDAEVSGLAGQIRAISGSLRPQTLDYLGLESAIRQLLDDRIASLGIAYVFEYVGLPDKVRPPLDITAYRIVQESVTNIVKHACATHVVVELNGGESGVELEVVVRDNGCGFETGRIKTLQSGTVRSGLLGLRERVGLIGGVFSVDSTKGRGTRIVATLPLQGVKYG